MAKCPYCNKEVTENEMFCWNCEADLSELKNKREKPGAEDLKTVWELELGYPLQAVIANGF